MKPVRVGFTTLLTGAIGSSLLMNLRRVLCLLPTESDARDYIVSDLEPIFAASLLLRGALAVDSEEGERNTLASKRFPGGSLRIVAARAPRNLQRHPARVLIVDEADACESGLEGNPIRLAERRTLSFANRKIIIGGTPLFEHTPHVLRSYVVSASLEPVYYEQLSSERRVVRYIKGQPVRRFERILGKLAEALDALVYAFAARSAALIQLDQRENELCLPMPPVPPLT